MALDPSLAQFIPGFIEEALGLCDKLSAAAFELESSKAQAPANTCARALHTLKGSAGTLGFDDVVTYTHALEDALKPFAKGNGTLPEGIVDVLVQSIGELRARFRGVQAGKDEPLNADDLIAKLKNPPTAAAPAPPPSVPEAALAPAPPSPTGEGARRAGEGVPNTPAAPPQAAPPSQPAATQPHVSERQLSGLVDSSERLRETWLKLEEQHRVLGRVVSRLEGSASSQRLSLESVWLHSKSELAELKELVDSVERGVKDLTTRPLEALLPPLQRGTRELCRKLGKQARLTMVGGEISVDRQVADALQGVLGHLLRNSVDHGLEQPHVRERHGKHPVGALVVRAERQGNVLFLSVSDDGAGIDREAVKRSAISKGMIDERSYSQLSEREQLELIFMSSLSTRSHATEISGRGVGLDAVRDEVQRLKGSIEVESTRGNGSLFTISLPVVYGSAPYLVFRAGETWLALPTSSVDRLLRLDEKMIQPGLGGIDLKLDDQLIALRDLGGLFGLREAIEPSAKASALVVYAHGKRSAFLVDEIEGERNLVLQVLPTQLSNLPQYQGVVTLGRGELCLVLRPRWLVDERRASETMTRNRPKVLVVDDSLTARALHRSMLEAAGYLVHAVSSGPQALEMLEHTQYEVMVSDVGMEPMDGYQLTGRVRARKESAQLPIVLVSAHDDEADRAEGLRSGADAFLSKRECAAGRLLAEVNAAIGRRREAA
ncbi:MAG: response regulator [Myxococcaceae bacterium]